MKSVVVGLEADTPTANGRIYPKEVLEDSIERWRNSPNKLFIYPYSLETYPPLVKDILGEVFDIQLNDKKLEIEYGVFLNQLAIDFAEIFETNDFVILPCIHAAVDEDNKVMMPASFSHFSILPKKDLKSD